jgi:thymidylate kinase
MINTRRRFLTTFFASLEANGVRYCILRNYDDLYADTSTDLDIIVSPYSLRRFERCMHEAAEVAGFRFVHTARYVNYSYVFWHPIAGFVRVDFETEIRWRLFTVLTAREVLDARRRHEEFFVPHPDHESVILFVAAVWRGELSERYRRQLAALYTDCSDKKSLRRFFVHSFGPAGNQLADFQARAETAVFDTRFCRRVRWSLMLLSHLGWKRVYGLALNTWTDGCRLLGRVKRPAGMSLLYVSSNPQRRNFEDLKQRINFLFPRNKCVIRTFDLSDASQVRACWTWRTRWERVRTMFKGGLFVRAYHVSKDEHIPPVARAHARYVYATRTFLCAEDSQGCVYFGHVSSGFMSTTSPVPGRASKQFSNLFIEFISNILERVSAAPEGDRSRRGLFCVLVGLDGSGKTTLGRNLCDIAVVERRFVGVRYFHWRPKCFRHVEFPLPEFRNTTRKSPLARNSLNSLLSAVRLAKNATLVNLAWILRVRPLLRRGYLVIVDRYFYNYWLDPASVKFAASDQLLNSMVRLFPRPELLVSLRAPQEILLARKQELSREEILEQVSRLERIKSNSERTVIADATQPAVELARSIMSQISEKSRHP